MSVQSDLPSAAACYCFDRKTAGQVLVYLLAKKANLLTMTPSELSSAAKCYCFNDDTQKRVVAYLLETISAQNQTPAQLADASKCFCFNESTYRSVVAYLLDIIAGGSGGPCPQDMQLAWTPANVKLGELMGFVSFDTTPALPGITSLTFNQATTQEAIDIENASDLTAIAIPLLLSITGSGYLTLQSNPVLTSVSCANLVTENGTGIRIKQNASLSSVSMPSLISATFLDLGQNDLTSLNLSSLQSVSGVFTIDTNINLLSISLPSLTTIDVVGGLSAAASTSLTNVSIPVLLPSNGAGFNFAGCNLNAASVNHILARAVANPAYVSGNMLLQGGTNAAPSGQGIADKATLIGRGVNVITN